MTSLRDIKRRLKSVESIKQIANAMQMVAASLLRRSQKKALESQAYANKIQEILKKLPPNDSKNPLFEKREVKKIGLLVVSGDRGLCGSYNSHIMAEAVSFINRNSDKEVELILIGRKGCDYFRNKKWPIRTQVPKWGGKITYPEVKKLALELVSGFIVKDFDEVWLVYSHFINIMSRKIKVEKFLNIEKEEDDKKSPPLNYLYEPSAAEIYAEIIPRYCITKIQHVLDEAYASELAARVVSMRSAAKNAGEVIEKLTLTRNKVRQENITKEMLEITAGAEGLK
jgi:F-type H+-transporting ATPase subunit gamma